LCRKPQYQEDSLHFQASREKRETERKRERETERERETDHYGTCYNTTVIKAILHFRNRHIFAYALPEDERERERESYHVNDLSCFHDTDDDVTCTRIVLAVVFY